MIIATLNIDWAGTYNGQSGISKVEQVLNTDDFDILVVTEAVELGLPVFPYVYKTRPLPIEGDYEGMDYGKYLKGKVPYRTIIYSKYPAVRSFDVTDDHTSVCRQFETDKGSYTIYATIVGTQYNRKPWVDVELENCVNDCKRIYAETKDLCLVGDLNTSFNSSEGLQISKDATEKLQQLFEHCRFYLGVAGIRNCIDHICIPIDRADQYEVMPYVFVEKDVVSDHLGVGFEID